MLTDFHSDILVRVTQQHRLGRCKVLETDYLKDWIKAGLRLVVCAIYINDGEVANRVATRNAFRQIAALKREVAESSDFFSLCCNFNDIEEAFAADKIALMLSLEGAEPLGDSHEMLEVFFRLGVRFLGLTHSRVNAFAAGASANKKTNRSGGLTGEGVKLVKLAEKLSVVLDVSHLNDEGTEQLLKLATKPVVASHSNSRSICGSFRNLTDAQLTKIRDSGGIVGLNGVNILTDNIPEEADGNSLLKQYMHLKKIVGSDRVALGLDIQDRLQDLMGGSDKLLDGRLVFVADVYQSHEKLNDFFAFKQLSSGDIENLKWRSFLSFLKRIF